MYQIEKKGYGFKITFKGILKETEMENWIKDSQQMLTSQKKDFGVFVDMRGMAPLRKESQKFMEDGQKMFRQKGMKRSVVILDSSITAMQFRQIARSTGIYDYERYINVKEYPNFEKTAMDWLMGGIDPDKINILEKKSFF
jgi:hypothetical protein